jgi:hypothetical protein
VVWIRFLDLAKTWTCDQGGLEGDGYLWDIGRIGSGSFSLKGSRRFMRDTLLVSVY